jgi:hypothetical protein
MMRNERKQVWYDLFNQVLEDVKRKKINTHENPQKMSNKKHNSRLGCGKRESPNHQKMRFLNEYKKSQYQKTFANPSWWKILNNQEIWKLCETKIRQLKGGMNQAILLTQGYHN